MRTESAIVSLLRQAPTILPQDSVYRALNMLRHSGFDTLPMVDGYGALRGVITLADLSALLAHEDGEKALYGPVEAWARPPRAIGHPQITVEEVRRALTESGETTLVIVDQDGHYLGLVSMHDLLAPASLPPRPATIGGMATPWGVYLTNGSLQAGASNLALVASGALLGLTLIFSHTGVGLLALLAQKAFGWPLFSLWSAPPPARVLWSNLDWYAMQALALPLFLGLLRFLPLTGYHAAEHQAVHAMERGEPLHPEVLRRMPRVHPRCGTNVMAGGVVFVLISQGLPALHLWGVGAADATVLGAIGAIFSWRRLGGFLQQHFTTRPANDREIASGIAAAQELEEKFLRVIPTRPTLARRLWCMGIPQILLGVSLSTTAAISLSEWLFAWVR